MMDSTRLVLLLLLLVHCAQSIPVDTESTHARSSVVTVATEDDDTTIPTVAATTATTTTLIGSPTTGAPSVTTTTEASTPLSTSTQTLVALEVQYPSSNLAHGDTLTLRGTVEFPGGGKCTPALSWTTGVQMTSGYNDTWSVALMCTGSTASSNNNMTVSFKPLVNDITWSIGANFNTTAAVGSTVGATIYPWFFTYEGQYHVYPQQVYSPQLKNWRPLVVYTPPSYYENTYKTIEYLLVMHDGENIFNASTSFEGVAWQCQNSTDLLIVEGAIEEVIILGVYNTINRTYEYTYSVDEEYGGGGGNIYLDFLEETVVPLIQSTYRVRAGADHTAMIGSSLGGLITCYAGWTRSDVYSKVGCMSSSFWWNNEDFNNTILLQDMPPTNPDTELYLDSGNKPGKDGDDWEETQTVLHHIESINNGDRFSLGENLFYYLQQGGQHSEFYWGARFHIPLAHLFPITAVQAVAAEEVV